jgi:hypothetical protein
MINKQRTPGGLRKNPWPILKIGSQVSDDEVVVIIISVGDPPHRAGSVQFVEAVEPKKSKPEKCAKMSLPLASSPGVG